MSEILLAEPRGFCAGVDRAIEIVERALVKFGRPIYVRHEIVHNTYVVNDLKAKGAIFIEELSDVPPGATLVFSAHGVSKAVQDEAQRRGFPFLMPPARWSPRCMWKWPSCTSEGYEFIMIGHKGHPEVEGTMGQLDAGIHLVEDVADVARVRPAQTGKARGGHPDHALGGRHGRNSRRRQGALPQRARAQAARHLLRHAKPAGRGEAAEPAGGHRDRGRQPHQLQQQPPARGGAIKLGTESYMVDSADELQASWFEGKSRVGLTAGASAPEILVRQVIERIKAMGAMSVRTHGRADRDGEISAAQGPEDRWQ